MNKEQRLAIEQKLKLQWEQDDRLGDFTRTSTLALETYGSEILGFMIAQEGNEDRAWDAFSLFSESLWKDIGKFQWRSSLRTWAYAIARRSRLRIHAEPAYRAAGNTGLSSSPSKHREILEKVRYSSLLQANQRRAQFEHLRAELDPDEQELLLLRLGGEMSWPAIARIVGEDPPVLRKRFERLKTKLRELASQRGLIDSTL